MQINSAAANGGNAGQAVLQTVTAKDFASKYREKHEVFHFLTHDCGVYLPHYDTVTIWHLRDIASGKRRKILGKDMLFLNVPQYEHLTIQDLHNFAKGYPEAMRALPEVEKETLKMPRQYLCNVIYTVVGMPFKKWVAERVDLRHKKIAEDRNMNIHLDPEIAAIFRASNAVSSTNGTGYNLMKQSAVRRRSKKQIEADKLAEARKLRETEQKLKELEQIKAELQENRAAMGNATQVMHDLYEVGLLKRTEVDGQVVPVETFEEYQELKEMKALEAQSQQSRQPSQAPSSQTQQLPIGSSLMEGNIGGPNAERARAPLQLEQADEDQPMDLNDFLNQSEGQDLKR